MVFLTLFIPALAAGQVLFTEEFSAGYSAWDLENSSYWSVVSGAFDVDMPDQRYQFAKAFAGDPAWDNYTFEFDVMGLKHSSKICYFRYQNSTTGYFLNFRGPVPDEGDDGALRLFKLDNMNRWNWGSWTFLTATPFISVLNTWYRVKIELNGPEIVVYVDNIEYIRYVDMSAPVLTGRIGFAGFTGANPYAGNHVRFDNVIVAGFQTVPVREESWGAIKALWRAGN